MKYVAVLVAVFSLLTVESRDAQAQERVWDNGTVWAVTFASTKPGKFNAYIDDLSNVWRVYLEEQKAVGDVVSYKILSVAAPRDGEPNLVLMVEYKNWAVFDQSLEDGDKLTKKVQGSIKKSQQANIDRGALRDIMGGLLAQEVILK